MKHAKTAALIAGSVVALGAASPAFAADAPAGHAAPSGPSSGLQRPGGPGAENALSGKTVGAAQVVPLVRSLGDRLGNAKSAKDAGDHARPTGRQDQQGPQEDKGGKPQQDPRAGKDQSSPLGPLGGITKNLPLLGGLPIG